MSQATHSPEGYTDAGLVAQLRAGDEAVVSRLADQWSPTMLRVARSLVDSPPSAEDVVQDDWLGMLSGLAKAAADTLARPLALALAPIRVNAISPGVIDTGVWDALGEQGKASYFADISARNPARRIGTPPRTSPKPSCLP